MNTYLRLVLLGIFLYFGTPLVAQVELRGELRAKPSGEPLPFASVELRSLRDTTFVLRGMSDLHGGYSFDPVRVGRYRLDIRCMGYQSVSRELRITLPSDGRVFHCVDSLSEDIRTLEGVVVEGVSSRQGADKRVFRFDASSLRASLHSYDLLKTLPFLQQDLQSEQLKGPMGGAVQILINGVRSDKNDLRTLPKSKIKHVEYYDIPPARYRQYECVINVVTYTLEEGYNYGGALRHALTTGFGNDELYGSYWRGGHKLSLEYTLNYRDYRHSSEQRDYAYELEGRAARQVDQSRERFGYTTHTPVLKYRYQQAERYLWELRLRPNWEHRHSDREIEGRYSLAGQADESLGGYGRDRTKIFSPSLDLYHWRRLGKQNELSLNLVGTLFSTRRASATEELETGQGMLRFEDFMQLHNSKRSVIGEVAYTHSFSGGTWNSGYRAEYASLSSELSNHYGARRDESRSLLQYAYSELSGRHRRWLYRLSLGLTHSDYNSDYRSYQQWAFTPKLVLGYNLSAGSSLRMMFDAGPRHPGVHQLHNNRVRLTRDISELGNPQLENQMLQSLTLLYNLQHRYIDLRAVGLYTYMSRPHMQLAERSADGYILRPVNGDWDKSFAFAVKAELKPFGDTSLSLRALVMPILNEFRSSYLSYRLRSVQRSYELRAQRWGFDLSYKYSPSIYTSVGAMAANSERQHELQLGYQHGAWRLSTSVLFVGASPYYHRYSLGASLVQRSAARRIADNKNMLTLGISYHFSRGEDKSRAKTLNNQDAAAPTL